jgi:hypothetical protein
VTEDRDQLPDLADLDLGRELDRLLEAGRGPSARSEDLQRGLASLVLTLVALLKDLMERQAVRRLERGTLTDEETERLGRAFLALDERLEELREVFGLTEEDLTIDLGPLGRLR